MDLIRRSNLPPSTYRPASIEDQFGRLIENAFEDFFAPFIPFSSPARTGSEGITSPRLNVVETDNSFELEAELPGVQGAERRADLARRRVARVTCRTAQR